MKTEQIRLIQDTYTVPAEVGGYLMTCPGCGARINLYDMYHGFCPWCESSMKKHRDRMIRILRTLDYRINQNESKNVIVPAGYLPVQQLQQLPAILLNGLFLALAQHGAGNPGLFGPHQGIGIGAAGHHQAALRVGQFPRSLCIQDGLQIGSSAGYQDRDF